ncbi:MAG: hypothetical protein CVU69_02020 [Deltaproteobacteria bacterium HGW-Deltaproteobacteria-4]|nr:MAG: hypothetical protein CVU69_02020 [Deltaproteobacteria bacterium HGW-Deltaproteobacteria-4]
MHPFKSLLLLLISAIFLTGMGNLGGAPVGTVPKVEEEIKAKVTDQSGIVTTLQQFSLDGQTVIEGERGNASVTIQLRDIDSLTLRTADEKDKIIATIKLKDGLEVQLHLRKRLIFNGSTGYGAFVIRAVDVNSIDIL